VFLAGTRKFDPPELAFYEQMNMKLFRSHELEKRPETLSDYLDILTASKLHIHLDLDVLDESVFQAVGYPSSEGLSFTGLTDLLNSLYASFDIVGFSMTEFMPKKQSDAKNFLSFFTHNPLL
jgi:arginase